MTDDIERENRSVGDFCSPAELREALQSMDVKRSEAGTDYFNFTHPALQDCHSCVLPPHLDTNEDSSNSPSIQELDPSLDWVLENYDAQATVPQTLDEELRRLMVLKSYLILDSERKESFERITGLASRMFKCPMALISLVDLGRQWFLSNRGLGETRETSRKYAFCAHAIMGKGDFLIVPDATKDIRFKDNPLVTGPPDIRFYAGAPLISPEGYKLGTLCVLDTKPRPQGIDLEEKQNLMELAALAVQSLVDSKRDRFEKLNDPAQLIAYTAHDMLTPLTGIQLSLSLLMEDADMSSSLTIQQKEVIRTASRCTDVMGRICQSAMDALRKGTGKETYLRDKPRSNLTPSTNPMAIADFVRSVQFVLDTFPKKVPLIITVHPAVPEAILTDDLKVFRAAVNYLTNACSITETGSVRFSISVAPGSEGRKILFECEDTGPGVPVEAYPLLFRPLDPGTNQEDTDACLRPTADGKFDTFSRIRVPNSGLGLYSVAVQISSLGGEYGFRPRNADPGPSGKPATGSVFWFKIPLILPEMTFETGGCARPRQSLTSPIEMMSTINDCLKDSDEDYNPHLVNVGTPSLSQDMATKLYSSFTRILENDPSEEVKCHIEVYAVSPIAEMEEDPTIGNGESIPAPPLPLTEAVPVPVGQKRKKKALVIEDSMVVRKSLTRVLMKLGFETVQAVDGMQGLKELQRTLFDVVLCDFLMPVMDGLDCVQQYRDWEAQHRPFFRQRIVGISAHACEKDIAKGMEVGMDDFKPKPVMYKQLAELELSEELRVIGEQLDEIAAAGTMMIDMSMDTVKEGGSYEEPANASTTVQSSEPKSMQEGDSSIHCCLVGIEAGHVETLDLERAAKNKSWKLVVVNDGEEMLRLMKIRNWDAIFVDEELPVLPAAQCVGRFREWEEQNRVNRQQNITLLSASCISMVLGAKSTIQLPSGFDLSLCKPIRVKDVENLMDKATRSLRECGVHNIVCR